MVLLALVFRIVFALILVLALALAQSIIGLRLSVRPGLRPSPIPSSSLGLNVSLRRRPRPSRGHRRHPRFVLVLRVNSYSAFAQILVLKHRNSLKRRKPKYAFS